MNLLAPILFFIILISYCKAFSLDVHDFTVKLGAKIDTSDNLQVSIHWEADPKATNYEIYLDNSGTFNLIEELSGTSNSFAFSDSEIFNRKRREIKLEKKFTLADSTGKAWGYLDIGYDLLPQINKGNVLLAVDNIAFDSIQAELDDYIEILNLNGFQTQIVEVPRSEYYNTKFVLQTKDIIRSKYNELKNSDETLDYIILIGKVAVPYSGSTSPDGHRDETYGAWPADHFYGEFDGKWTDYRIDTVRDLSIEILSHHNNSAWDGKWDQTILPSGVEASVGRIDVSDLRSFEESEFDLLKRYIKKNIAWRNGEINYPRRAIIDDKFKLFNSEIFGTEAWMNFSALVNHENIDTLNARYTLRDQEYLFFWGAASGGYTSIHETVYTDDYAIMPYYGVFGFIFGSRIIEFTHWDNPMKGMIASNPSFLTSIWSVRPNWLIHTMATGNSIGKASLQSINYGIKYDVHGFKPFTGAVFMNIIGDPTLEMLVTKPPQNATKQTNGNTLTINWDFQEEAEYYNIYHAESIHSEKAKLNSEPISASSFITDSQEGIFIIKSVKLQETNSSSYWLESVGIVAE